MSKSTGLLYDMRSTFMVLNNPEWDIVRSPDGEEIGRVPSKYNGMTPDDICKNALNDWLSHTRDDTERRSGAVLYCISADGLHHLHMVLECDRNHKFGLTELKVIYPKAHIEPTRGTKKQAEAYINKIGPYAEKGETIIAKQEYGTIHGAANNKATFEAITASIEEGARPSEIYKQNVQFRRYEGAIKGAYFAKRLEDTPTMRDVKTYWHYGEPGSGKSFTCEQLIEQYGRDEVYHVTSLYKGAFDLYEGQRILFIDELDFRSVNYKYLLVVLDKYTRQIESRYANSFMLWDEVHITCVLPPDEFYRKNVDILDRKFDPFSQLLRRLHKVIEHYIDKDGNYCTRIVHDDENLSDSEFILA